MGARKPPARPLVNLEARVAESFTTSRPGDWDRLAPATTGVSHRSTTSSRLPGKAIEGTVHYRIARVVECSDCGGMMRETFTGYPHGVRWNLKSSVPQLIDCIGRVVPLPQPK